MVEGLRLCQETNVFEFKDQLYRQKVGHAIGQKQAPPVACLGAGQVERKFLNLPRDIVYDETPGIMSRRSDDPIFYKVCLSSNLVSNLAASHCSEENQKAFLKYHEHFARELLIPI